MRDYREGGTKPSELISHFIMGKSRPSGYVNWPVPVLSQAAMRPQHQPPQD